MRLDSSPNKLVQGSAKDFRETGVGIENRSISIKRRCTFVDGLDQDSIGAFGSLRSENLIAFGRVCAAVPEGDQGRLGLFHSSTQLRALQSCMSGFRYALGLMSARLRTVRHPDRKSTRLNSSHRCI